jgi:PadR family transcriptional regulator, regulatory protein PadR
LTQPKADILQGTLVLLFLKALSLGPLHGYGVIQRIRQLSSKMLNVEQGRFTRRSIGSSSMAPVSSKWG